MASSSAFTRAVVIAMRKIYPEALADQSFDNTGLLLEAPSNSSHRLNNSALLTIDLTRAVVDEAIKNKHSIVIAYHPIIFRGLKSLTLADSQQSSLLRLATAGISVYSPHTAVDAVPGGMADWLCDIVAGPLDASKSKHHTSTDQDPTQLETEDNTSTLPSSKPPTRPSRPGAPKRTYSKPSYPTPTPLGKLPLHPSPIPHTRDVIHPSPASALSTANSFFGSESYTASNTGAGRLLTFTEPQPLTLLVERIAIGVGKPKGFPVAIPQNASVEDISIRTIALCPGSGSSVVKDTKADLIFTGEFDHHSALAVTERGGCVVTLFHSNSERGFLEAKMKADLEEEVKKAWKEEREKGKEEQERGEVTIEISKADRDPYGIVVLE